MADSDFIIPNSQQQTNTQNIDPSNRDDEILAELRAMNENLKSLNSSMRNMSQSNASDNRFRNRTQFRDKFKDDWKSSWGKDNWGRGDTFSNDDIGKEANKRVKDSLDRSLDSFLDGIDEGIDPGIFKKGLQEGLKGASKETQEMIKTISGMSGKELGKQAATLFKSTKFGKQLFEPWDNLKKVSGEAVGNVIKSFGNKGFGAAKDVLASGGTKTAAAEAFGKAGLEAASKSAAVGLKTVGSAALAAGPQIAAMIFLEAATDELAHDFQEMSESISGFNSEFMNTVRREEKERKRYNENAQTRLRDDVKTMVEIPFKILEDAANRLYQAWDDNIKLINQTQGYTKSDLQSLLGEYAERARNEGLSKYISAADLADNLGKVLQSGLSGKIAEEFAYQATVLNSAIPSQDFFNYAESYASIAANLIKNGSSQDAAIQKANESLQTFANSLLYASRELSGGFSTGLQSASDLYNKAVNISVAARTNNPNEIAGVLTSVAAVTGAIAPDLATSITDAIYQAATGGNSDSLVALRSLAGINASNTEFLRAFAENPQKVFSALFNKLADMYNSNNGAFMEVAEGFSGLFGLSMEAFQRVDFNYLANAIDNMNINSDALQSNLELLQSGQTTLTKDQLRNQQINEYMIEEGLSYVLDSEAGRLIQEHMWEEQIANQIMETEFGVELHGKAIDLLDTIGQSVKNILNIVNPFAVIESLTRPFRALEEESGLEKDIAGVLEATRVGNGRAEDLRNLLTRGTDLQLTSTLIELLGGQSQYRNAQLSDRAARQMGNSILFNPLGFITDSISKSIHTGMYQDIPNQILSSLSTGGASSGLSSAYSWGMVSKSGAAAANAMLNSGIGKSLSSALRTTSVKATDVSGSKAAADALSTKIENMLNEEYMVDQFVKKGKTYSEFAASASQFGISDFSKALDEAGYTESQVQSYFEQASTNQGIEEMTSIRADEKDFRDAGRQFWRVDFWEKYTEPFFEELDTIEEEYLQVMINNQTEMIANQVKQINNQIDWKKYYKEKYVQGWLNSRWDKQFWKQFNDYFFEHKIYNGGSLQLNTLEKVQKAEKAEKGDVANALSEYLTQNNQSLEALKDPTVQTNMLLSQILITVNAIMNQTARTEGTISLSESISALANGLIKQN